MADTKISALTTLVAGDIQHTSDVVAIVDTSVTTTKKATAQAVVNAVLAQNTDTTVTGTINQTTIPTSKTLLVSTDIGSTVQGYDATTLKSANIGVTVQGYDAQLADVAGLAVTDGNFIVGNGTNFVAESGATARTSLGLGTGDSPEFTAVNIGSATDTTITRSSAGVIAVEGSNVLMASNIGTTVQGYDADTAKLDVAQTFTAAQTFNNPTVFSAGTASLPSITFTGDTNTGVFSPAADTIAFAEGGVEAARFDSAGNFGLGVTPSAWSTASSTRAMQLPGGGTIWSQNFSGNNPSIQVACNAYLDSVGYKYFQTAEASQYQQNAGTHVWQTAASGTAGNAISFTQAMTLDASGNLGIGVTPSAWSAIKPVQTGLAASFSGGSAFNDAFIASNAYYDGTNWRYINTNTAYYNSVGGDAAARWYTAASGTAGNTITFSERMRIDSSGNLLVGITSARSNAGDVQVSKGISFPATQSAQSDANTLDDYEEGTFTPTVSAASVTYAANGQIGKYTKIGNVVYIHIYVEIATITTNSSNNLINGLPFASIAGIYPKLATMWNGFDFGGTVGVCQVTTDSTVISAGGCTNNAAFVDSFASGFAAGDWISVTGHYYV